MDDKNHLPCIDLDRLKREIAEAVRTTIWELARDRGMTVGDFIDSFVKSKDQTRRL